MNTPYHGFRELFDQLGLASDDESIQAFLTTNGHLPETVLLADAPFWTPAQALFLRQSKAEDADWAHIVDSLNAALRAP